MKRGLFFVLLLCLALSGCATKVTVNEGFQLDKEVSLEVGLIENQCGVDPESNKSVDLMREAIDKALAESELPVGKDGYKLNITITEYAPGDAFKRWLMPGWGETKLSIKCNIVQLNENIGEIVVTKSIAAGGGYTVGAWKTVFNEVAKSVVGEIKTRSL